MSSYSLEQWLDNSHRQPPVPADLPQWMRAFVRDCREGDIHDFLNDSARIVPSTSTDGTPPRYSAVLILIGGGETSAGVVLPDDATLLLTHRAPSMRNHSGQMAFPGGSREDQDPDPIATALREAEEETGLDPATVEPCAVLQPIYIDRTNFAVIPVVAYWREPHRVFCASSENDWVEPYPLRALVDPAHRFTVEFLGWSGPAWHIPLGPGQRETRELVLWGFTGGVVNAILRRAAWEQPWNSENRVDLVDALKRSANGEAIGSMIAGFRNAGPEGGAP